MIGLPPTNAFVLQRTPYREESWLLRLLTAEQGQVTAHFRGSDPVYLYQPYHAELQGRNDWQQCRHLEMAGPLLRLQGRAAYLALYINELCGRLVPRWVNAEDLFGTYYATLKALQAGEPAEPLLRYFERRLLAQLGFAVDFAEDTDGEPIQADRYYRFDGHNRFICSTEGPLPGQCLLGIDRNHYDDREVRRVAKAVFRQALNAQLGEQALSSRDLFRLAAGDHSA